MRNAGILMELYSRMPTQGIASSLGIARRVEFGLWGRTGGALVCDLAAAGRAPHLHDPLGAPAARACAY